MRDHLPDFMNVLKGLPGGLPNLHVAVVSSSLGAGKFGNVPGCFPNSSGNLDGAFQHAAGCTGLHQGERFISSVADPTNPKARMNNFDGDITDVFKCIADLGEKGCGFEHQFAATQYALEKARAGNSDNAGFLRDGAYLAIVMLTNEDDCSVDPTSDLLDPGQISVKDALGGLQSWRCNEFGHKCDNGPPHDPPGMRTTYANCHSAEDGRLVTVKSFTEFVKSLKPGHPEQILVAALAGQVTPYQVESKGFTLGNGTMENQPTIVHSCTSGTKGDEYADPAVRIKEWLDQFGADNAVFDTICANDFSPAMKKIANTIGRALGAQCVTGKIGKKDDGTDDCSVTEQTYDDPMNPKSTEIPHCDGMRTKTPCWEFKMDVMQCPGADNRLLSLCYDATCTGGKPSNKTDAIVSCAVGQ